VWPFRRKTAPDASGTAAPAPVIRHDWAALPTIQRVIGDHPLTAPSDRFSDDLATHHNPSVTSAQMGHQVSAEAPAGMVLTLARTSTRSDGPAMIPRPRVQRRADGVVATSGEWDGDEAATAEARPAPVPAGLQRIAAVERPVVARLPEQPPLTTLPAEAEPVPLISKFRKPALVSNLEPSALQREAVLHGPVPAPPPRLTLGQARRLGLGAPITQVPDRTGQRSWSQGPEMPLPPAAQPAQPGETPGADEPGVVLARSVEPQRASLPADTERQTPVQPSSVPASTPLTASTSESPRLDLPLAPPPPLARPAESPSAAGAAPSSEGRSVDVGPIEPSPADGLAADRPSSTAPAGSPSQATIATPIIQRSTEPTLALPRPAEKPLSGPVIEASSSSAIRSEHPSLPLRPRNPQGREAVTGRRGDEPIGPVTVMQRMAESGATDTDPSPSPSPSPSAPAASLHMVTSTPTSAQRLVGESSSDPLVSPSPARVGSVSPAPFSPAPTLPLAGTRALRPTTFAQRISESAAGSTPEPVTPGIDNGLPPAASDGERGTTLQRSSIAGRVLTPVSGVPAQRHVGALPLTTATPAHAFQAQRLAADGGTAATPEEALPLGAPAASAPRSDLPLAPLPSVQRLTAETATPAALESSPILVAQREADAGPAPAEAPAAGPSAGAAPPGAGAEAHSEKAIEELAGKLYDRIRSRLKTELLIDRERAGLLTDLR